MPDPKRYDEFVALIERHTGRILAYIDALLTNWADAEDIFQDTCMVLWEKFDEFKPGTNFLAWALRIADFRVMRFHTNKSRRVAFTEDLRNTLMANLAKQAADEDPIADLKQLSTCMDKLPESDRRMVGLCYIENVPVRNIAEAFGRSPQSVHNSLARIRRWLLDCIRRESSKADWPDSIGGDALKREDQP
jgi:RNA polymerase sigma-70 factor, ECF subfamily